MSYTVTEVMLTPLTIKRLYQLDAMIFTYDVGVTFEGSRWWVVEDEDGHAVGFSGLRHMYGDRVFLCRSGVRVEHRGHGLQRRMIRVRERAARAQDMKRVVTYTDKNNVHSSNNLIACGYQLYRPADEWGCAHALYWFRDL